MNDNKKKYFALDYETTDIKGLRKNKESDRDFLFDFRVYGKRYRKKFQVKATNQNPKENLEDATQELFKYKKSIKNGNNLTDDPTMDECFYGYMKNKDLTDWNIKLIKNYNIYIGDCELVTAKGDSRVRNKNIKKYSSFKIGDRKISKIKLWHLKDIVDNMKNCGLSERTQNSIFEILNPLYKNMIEAKIIEENIADYIKVKIDIKKQKKQIVNAEKLFTNTYDAIQNIFKDQPYYKALFLFGLTGRRKNEILNIKWSDISLEKNYYVLNDPKADAQQKFLLPLYIKKELLSISDNKRGYVFKSPVKKGQPIKNIDGQVSKIRKYVDVDQFSLHYMRHILVSALFDRGAQQSTLTAVLGHTDIHSINRYVSVNNLEGGKIANPMISEMLEIDIEKRGEENV